MKTIDQSLAERRLYSITEASKVLGRSSRWVRDRVKAGELVGVRVGRLMIHGPSINRYIASRQY